MSGKRRQLVVFAVLLATNALLAFLTFALGLQDQLLLDQGTPSQIPSIPSWLLGLANAGLIVILYGLFGVAGFWLARKLGLPGVFRERAGWRNWLVIPMTLGVIMGIVITVVDRIFASVGNWNGFEHPPFPMSLIASATAGIGEEILFRGFVMVLCAFLLNLILKRWEAKKIALWTGNVIGALAFAAGHLPSAMMLLGVTSPAEIPPLLLLEGLVLNGIVGLVAGAQYFRNGLVGAVGVHFWVDVVWHVICPLAATA